MEEHNRAWLVLLLFEPLYSLMRAFRRVFARQTMQSPSLRGMPVSACRVVWMSPMKLLLVLLLTLMRRS
jgi:hypothetical protein